MNALIVICGLSVVSLIAEIANFKKWLVTITLLGLIAATVVLVWDWNATGSYFSDMLVFDHVAQSFTAIILIASILWFWMARDYFNLQTHKADRTSLVIFAVVGAVIMTSYNNMAMLFLGIEVLSLSLYVLAGSNKESLFSTEAAFKYFLMGSFATGFLLMGIALVYGATGSFHIHTISEFVSAHSTTLPLFFHAGVLLILIGLAFKISAVPFHFWAPDVYDGSPTMVTAFMSTVVKIGAIGAFYRMFAVAFPAVQSSWIAVMQVMVVLTLVLPNVTAVYQNNVKRMLAYSSVGHVGYILLAFIAGNAAGAVVYYLLAYALASLAAFSVLHIVEGKSEASTVEYFNGLFKRNPLLAVGFTLALLSLAGIPPLPGFFGKYMVFALAIQQGYVGLVILAVVTSLIGVYYYFRVIIAMYFRDPMGAPEPLSHSQTALTYLLIALTFALALFPDVVLALVAP